MSLRKGRKKRDSANILQDNIMDKKRREKRVSFTQDTDTTFDESATIMDHPMSESEEKGLPNEGKMSKIFWNQRGRPPTLFSTMERLFCVGVNRNTFQKVKTSQENYLRNFLSPRTFRDQARIKVNKNVRKHYGSTRLLLKLETLFRSRRSCSMNIRVLIQKVIPKNVSERYLQYLRKV